MKPVKDKCKGLNEYIAKDKKYMMIAITETIRRFGPSGSAKRKNIVREERRDVMNKIMRSFFEGDMI